ncbi:MAG: DUF58 domain-containing protein [Microthrixaceae bacterium]
MSRLSAGYPSAPPNARSETTGSGIGAGRPDLSPRDALTDGRTNDLLRRLELDVSRRLDGILHGDHRGLVPGHGSEPGEAREYQPGDDVRRIDWNVTARTGEPHLRESIADRELETWLVADRSASLDFGTANWEKRDLVLAAAAGVGFLTAWWKPHRGRRARRRPGGHRASPTGTQAPHGGPPSDRRNPPHRWASGGGTRPADRPGGLLGAPSEPCRRDLRLAGSGRVVAHAARCAARPPRGTRDRGGRPRELELPRMGVVMLRDPERGVVREVDTNRGAVRERFREAAMLQREEIASAITSTGARHLTLRTDRDWLVDVARNVSVDRRRQANVGGRR